MSRSPLALAALATVAVPGLDVVEAGGPPTPDVNGDIAYLTDTFHQHWVVRAPDSPVTGAALEAELALIDHLAVHCDDGTLPFDVPRIMGTAPLQEGGRAVVYPQLPGVNLDVKRLAPGPGLSASLGRALGAIHELPTALVESVGLPAYESEEYRLRRLAELDEAAASGHVPVGLLRRWEQALEDVSWWRFRPTVVHGDLTADHIMVSDTEVTAILSWDETKVADPADDLAWLFIAAPEAALESIVEAYVMARSEASDPHLADRALLAGELALVRWLLHGVHNSDRQVINDAVQMLEELDSDLFAAQESPEQ